MARHLERAENTARLVSVHSETRLDWPDSDEFAWEPVLRITGTLDDFEARGLSRTDEDAAEFLLSDPWNPSSLLSICARARENNRTLIDILPRESWEEVNELHQLTAQPGVARADRRGEHLREVIGRAQAMAGLFLGALNDDEGYAVLRLGRAIERGDFATRVMLGRLEIIEHGASDHQVLRGADWVGALRSLTAFQMYRRSVLGPVTGPRVIRFITCSTVFPRALAYCAREAERALARLPGSSLPLAAAERLSTALASEHCLVDNEAKPTAILTAVQKDLAALHESFAATYFVPQPEGPFRAGQRQTQST
ncbi:alpha-E domain-containing protein, partial [Rubellimicrobium rubrum]